MPEYLSPGVYIEEVSFRSKNIEGVSTSTAGFVGPTRYGPVTGEPLLVTSYAEFSRYFGGLDALAFTTADGTPTLTMDNYMAHAVRAFFDEGGKRLYISRIFRSRAVAGDVDDPTLVQQGLASTAIPDAVTDPHLNFTARYPGTSGNVQITFTVRVGQNSLRGVPSDPANLTSPLVPVLRGVNNNDLVLITDTSADSHTLYRADQFFDNTTNQTTWRFWPATGAALALGTLNVTPAANPNDPDPRDLVRVITVGLDVVYPGRDSRRASWDNLGLCPEHPQALSTVFGDHLGSQTEAALTPFVFAPSATLNGPQIADLLFAVPRPERELARLARVLGLPDTTDLTDSAVQASLTVLATLHRTELSDNDRQITISLTNGNDGVRPEAGEYEGVDDPVDMSGLRAFENVPDISIVAAPGATFNYDNATVAGNADQITRHLIGHCERMRYRIAVLEPGDGMDIGAVREFRSGIDTSHAALYYPWIQILDPLTGQRIFVPPAGAVAGIYARNDVQRGVHKAPANEVVRQAIGLEVMLNKAHQDVLNPEGVNAFRFFEGRGFRLWGARTASSDPEWVYVNLRRYFAYLERSIERGTQWVVFEPNSERLWANVRRTIEDFLFNEWKSNRLMGLSPDEAYFVKCDRSTMTQNDLDSGRLICLIGVAPIRPAEFVIFRIGQWTASQPI